MTEVEQMTLLLVAGQTLLVVLLLRTLNVRRRAQLREMERARRSRQAHVELLREQHRARVAQMASRVGDPRPRAAAVGRAPDAVLVLYSPEAQEQLVRLGVSREHVETVVAHPTLTTRRPADRAVQLERDFGSHTLRLRVAGPWPAAGSVYVTRVEWS